MKKIISVKNMIEIAVTKSNILRVSMIKGAWGNIVENFWLKSEPLGLRDGLLYVAVENSVLLHAMTMKKEIYIQKINSLLRGEYVIDIKYRVKKINIDEKFERGEQLEVFIKEPEEIMEYKTENMSIDESIKYLSKLSKQREEKLLKKGYKKCLRCKKIFLGKESLCSNCRGEKENLTINRY